MGNASFITRTGLAIDLRPPTCFLEIWHPKPGEEKAGRARIIAERAGQRYWFILWDAPAISVRDPAHTERV